MRQYLSFGINELNGTFEDIARPNTFVESVPTDPIAREYFSDAIINTLSELRKVRRTSSTGGFDACDDVLSRVSMATVNMVGFGNAVDRNQRMALSARQVPMLSMEEIEGGARGVVDSVASYVDLNIDDIIECSEVKTLVEEFLSTYEMLAIEEGVNLWSILCKARMMDQTMIKRLRTLVEKYSLDNLIESVLRNTRCLTALEGVLN